MNTLKTKTLIIGAGPAGLSCAMELSRAGEDFIVIEKESGPGGLARTYAFTEKDGLTFYTDNGPHRFFSKNAYLYEFIEGLIGEEWIKVRRQTRQYIDGVFYDYPINALQALKNIGILRAARMVFDYGWAKIQYGLFRKPIVSFKDYVYANFGKSLAEFNMVNYTEKIWGIPADTIHTDFAAQRIKGLSLTSVLTTLIKRAFGVGGSSPKSLVDEFYYPSKGTGLIYDTIVSQIQKQGRTVLFDTEPVMVKLSSGETEVVVKNKNGEETRIVCTYLVESVPITKFLKLLQPSIPHTVNEAVSRLRHRAQVYLFVTLNKETITPDQWVYFPSQKTPVGRVSEMRNFSKEMSPEGKTSLFVEFFCFEGDEIWNASKNKLLQYTLDAMQGLGLRREEVRESYVIKKTDVYPVYDLEYETHLNVIKEYLEGFERLYYIGRPGRFRYNNQDHSLEMGMLAAQSIIECKRYDIESVGEEKEYFEKGDMPTETKKEKAVRRKPVVILSLGILAALSIVFLFFQPGIKGDAVSYYNSMVFLEKGTVSSDFSPNRLLTTYGGLQLVIILSGLTGSLLSSWMMVNTVLYVASTFVFYSLLRVFVKGEREALYGTLFLVFNYSFMTFGLNFLMDIGGWSAYIFSLFFGYRYLDTKKYIQLVYAALAVGVGVLFKEYAVLGTVVIAVILIAEHHKDPKLLIKRSLPLALISIVPILCLYGYVYKAFGYTYLDWLHTNEVRYEAMSKVSEYIKTFGSLLNFMGFLVLGGAYVLYKDWKQMEQKNKIFIAAALVSFMPLFLWPGITQRVIFVSIPALISVSVLWVKKYPKYHGVVLTLLVLYVLTNLFMDSFVLTSVNLPL